ncbi:D-isomer specific 2-hydroxyacid dehydrogenase [Jackrogersella minutella]|nr:D-isomer specific 2-hydroxyacid dehydrogenase [Jackrogersella minutella]
MSSPPTVLLIGDLAHTNKDWEALGSNYKLLEFRKGTREQFLENCRNGTYAEVRGCYRSNVSTAITGPFNQELVAALPESWKFIAHNGAGYDNIDVEACSARKIAVSSTPVAVDDATADVGIFLLLGALRQAHGPLVALREGRWKGKLRLGHDPKGKTLGILGMGGIGRAMAHRARSFGMEIIYHNRRQLDSSLEKGAKYVSFEELLAQSDVLSLNLALNASTRHIISAPELAKTKKGVVIVNTARGALINEADLVDALESGQVSTVGLDVFENEPEIHPGLVKNDRAFLLPHLGTSTVETQHAMELLVLKNLQVGVDQGKMLTLVGEQKGLDWAPEEVDF